MFTWNIVANKIRYTVETTCYKLPEWMLQFCRHNTLKGKLALLFECDVSVQIMVHLWGTRLLKKKDTSICTQPCFHLLQQLLRYDNTLVQHLILFDGESLPWGLEISRNFVSLGEAECGQYTQELNTMVQAGYIWEQETTCTHLLGDETMDEDDLELLLEHYGEPSHALTTTSQDVWWFEQFILTGGVWRRLWSSSIVFTWQDFSLFPLRGGQFD